MSHYDPELYDLLSKLRLQFAEQANLPAFAVFHNRSLAQMAQLFPGTQEEFLKIEGVGPAKWEKYGKPFLDLIIQYCADKDIPHQEVPPKNNKKERRPPIQVASELAPLIEKLLDFRQRRNWEQFHSPKNLVMALASEVGELIDHFRWLTEQQSYLPDEKSLPEVRDELGDVMLMLLLLSHELGICPVEAADQKLSKLEHKYPEELSRNRVSKHTAYADSPQVKSIIGSGAGAA